MDIIVISLAVWRLSSLFAIEDGPFFMFTKFRHLVGVEYDDKSETFGTNEFARGILCVWCNSLWISAFASLLLATDILSWLVYTLAISAITIIINRIING